MENKKVTPKIIQVTGGNLEIRKVSPLSDNSVNIIINIGEQEDEVLGFLYGMKKRGAEFLLLSDIDLSSEEAENLDFEIHEVKGQHDFDEEEYEEEEEEEEPIRLEEGDNDDEQLTLF